MAVLLTCAGVGKSHGSRSLFQGVSLAVSDGDRFGLIGPNGSGKTTLLRILAGLEKPDSGAVAVRKQARVAYVPQDPVFAGERTVGEILEAALAGIAVEAEEKTARIQAGAGRAGFTDFTQRAGALSGGWRKRLALASALAAAPDLLLLDEPTNHLDIEGILWLEQTLTTSPFASVFASHDRYFLENTASRMGELNRAFPDGVFIVPGNYSEFLARRADFLEAQRKQQQSLAAKVRREIEWLRRGAKARTTKSRARVAQAGRMMEELQGAASRSAPSAVQIDFSSTGRRTRRLVTAEGISKRIGGRTLFAGLDFVLSPGVCMGLVGANGTGKTTLLRILAGELEPDQGAIRRADGLRTVYFDQNREQLDPAAPLGKALAPDGDMVVYRGRPVHVNGWAKRFLFQPGQLDLPVESLSGGEKARVLIARLMLEPADVLLLDEPANDLDIPTLEVLEDSLADFPGALVLVTHDRFLLERLATFVVALNGDGSCGVFAGLEQWEASLAGRREQRPAAKAAPREAHAAPAKKKLSYLEQREWDQMEEKILAAEQALEALHAGLQSPECAPDPVRLQECYRAIQERQAEVNRLYDRWAELESKLA